MKHFWRCEGKTKKWIVSCQNAINVSSRMFTAFWWYVCIFGTVLEIVDFQKFDFFGKRSLFPCVFQGHEISMVFRSHGRLYWIILDRYIQMDAKMSKYLLDTYRYVQQIDDCQVAKFSTTQGRQRAGSVESVPSLPSDQSNLDGPGVARFFIFYVSEIRTPIGYHRLS